MNRVSIKHFDNGYGVETSTYFKLLYAIPSGDDKYSIIHIAIFGVN